MNLKIIYDLLPSRLNISSPGFPNILTQNLSYGLGGSQGEGAIVGVLQNLISLLTGDIMKALFVLFLLGCFYAAWVNRLQWSHFVRGCIAAGCIMGAGHIAQFLLGNH